MEKENMWILIENVQNIGMDYVCLVRKEHTEKIIRE